MANPEFGAVLTADATNFMGAFRGALGGVNSLGRGISGFNNLAGRAIGAVTNTARRMAIGITAGTAAVGAGLALAIRQAGQFEKAMAEVGTLTNATAEDLKTLSEGADRLSRAFGSPQVEQAAALYQILSAGVTDTTQALQLLEAANKLAVGGVTTTDVAVTALAGTMNAYGMEATQVSAVSDLFFQTVRLGVTTVDQLANVIGRVSPLAAAAGVSLQEVLSAFATLTTQNISTSEAASGLRALITALARIEDIDVDAGLGEAALVALDRADGDIGKLTKLLGSIEAVNAALALTTGQGATFSRNLGEMGRSAGSTQEAFDRMAKTSDFQMKQLRATVASIVSLVGAAFLPVVNDMGNKLRQALEPSLQFLIDNRDMVTQLIQRYVELGRRIVNNFFQKVKENRGTIEDFFGGLMTLAKDAAREIGAAAETFSEWIKDDENRNFAINMGKVAGAFLLFGPALTAASTAAEVLLTVMSKLATKAGMVVMGLVAAGEIGVRAGAPEGIRQLHGQREKLVARFNEAKAQGNAPVVQTLEPLIEDLTARMEILGGQRGSVISMAMLQHQVMNQMTGRSEKIARSQNILRGVQAERERRKQAQRQAARQSELWMGQVRAASPTPWPFVQGNQGGLPVGELPAGYKFTQSGDTVRANLRGGFQTASSQQRMLNDYMQTAEASASRRG